MADNSNNMRQKITVVAFILVLVFLAWQIWGMFASDSASSSAPTYNPQLTPAQRSVPIEATIKPKTELTAAEQARQQQQAQAEDRYINLIQELQALKVEKDIAEANKSIMAAKLDTVTAQTKIVTMLGQPATPAAGYAPQLVNPVSSNSEIHPSAPPTSTMAQDNNNPPVINNNSSYTVISVSKLRSKWQAVLGNQNSLYNVAVGDILPADNSKVVSIDSAGVVLENNGKRRKISLVPII